MVKITLHSLEQKYEVLIPSAWHELTLKQLIDIESKRTAGNPVLEIFCILTGLKIEVADNIQNSTTEAQIFSAIEFLNNPPAWDKLKHPTHFQIAGKAYKVPNKIGELMFGQKVMVMQSFQTAEDMLKNIPMALAVIFQPIIDKAKNKGKLIYDSEKVDQLQGTIEKSNGLDAYATALFFFLHLKPILATGLKDLKQYQESKHPMKKLSPNWLKPNG